MRAFDKKVRMKHDADASFVYASACTRVWPALKWVSRLARSLACARACTKIDEERTTVVLSGRADRTLIAPDSSWGTRVGIYTGGQNLIISTARASALCVRADVLSSAIRACDYWLTLSSLRATFRGLPPSTGAAVIIDYTIKKRSWKRANATQSPWSARLCGFAALVVS